MKNPRLPILFVTTLTVLTSGCVTGHRTVEFEPAAPASIAPADEKGTVTITTITDDRVFQNKPSDPSTPSIQGDVTTMTDSHKIRMIGRQRNSYGGAAGDVALADDDSIIIRTRTLLERGFAAQGYRSTDGTDPTISADVSVKQFWAWSTPGMWSIKVEAQIKCTLSLNVGDETKTLVVEGYGIKGSSTAVTNETWEIVYNLAFDDFLNKLEAQLTSMSL